MAEKIPGTVWNGLSSKPATTRFGRSQHRHFNHFKRDGPVPKIAGVFDDGGQFRWDGLKMMTVKPSANSEADNKPTG